MKTISIILNENGLITPHHIICDYLYDQSILLDNLTREQFYKIVIESCNHLLNIEKYEESDCENPKFN